MDAAAVFTKMKIHHDSLPRKINDLNRLCHNRKEKTILIGRLFLQKSANKMREYIKKDNITSVFQSGKVERKKEKCYNIAVFKKKTVK